MDNSNTVFCRDCGTKISEKAEICPECGIRQKGATPPQPITSPPQKDPGIAAVASLIIPGAGQIYNGQILKGIITGVVTIVSAITVVGLVVAIPLWIYLVYDGYKTAQNLNKQAEREHASRIGVDIDYETIIAALKWSMENESGAGITKDALREVRKKDVSDLSKRQVERIIYSLENYKEQTNPPSNVDETREELIQLWERKAGSEWRE